MNLSSHFHGAYAVLKGNFLLLIITWILIYSAQPIPQTYASLYYLNLGADEFLLSVIGFAGSIAIALVQFPGGYLADKHGRKWLISTMTYGLGFAMLFFIFAPSWQFIVLGLIIQNLCMIYQPALLALMLDSLPPEHRGMGYNLQSVVTNLVSLPAPIIAQFLILLFHFDIGMRIAYVILLIAFLSAATLRIKLKETLPANDNTVRPKILDALKEYPKSVKESLQVWSKVPKSAFYLFISNVGINGLVFSCQTYFVVYATETVLKITESQWAIVMTFMYLSISLPGILAGLRMDAVGRKHFLILGYLLYVPAMLLFVTADFNRLLLAFFFFGLGQMLQVNSYQVILGDLIPRGLRGKAVGCSQFFMYLVQAFTQVFVGLLYAYVSPQLPFLLLAVTAAPLSILVMFRVFEPSSKEV